MIMVLLKALWFSISAFEIAFVSNDYVTFTNMVNVKDEAQSNYVIPEISYE